MSSRRSASSDSPMGLDKPAEWRNGANSLDSETPGCVLGTPALPYPPSNKGRAS